MSFIGKLDTKLGFEKKNQASMAADLGVIWMKGLGMQAGLLPVRQMV